MIADVVLRGLIPEVCNVYIDDIIIASSSFDEQLHHMELVFHRLKKYNITVKLSKCVFASPTVQYLGHMISSRGVHITDERKEHIRNIRRPITVSELHSFLGLCNYFRDFISHFAEIAAPLYYHLKRKPKAVIPWTHEDTTAFEMIRDSVSSALPLAFLQESGQIILYTDASDQALGGHLVQIQRLPGSSVDQEVTIAFVSKKFTDVQRRWSTTDKECYAILFSIEKLRHMLGGRRFSVRTDHACLSHWINDSIHSLKIQRWKLKLSEFDFDVTHIAGLQNNVADVLSRLCAGTSAKVEPQDDIDDQSDKSIKELISRAHNDMVGHCGVRETIRRLKKDKISIPKLYKSVQQFVSSCSTCQRMNHTVKRYSAPHFTVIDGTPFAKIAIDTLGPLDDDPKFKYVVVFVDSMSRFVQFEPIPDLNGTTFLPILRNYICRWNPKAIQFDNHGQYNNHQVTQLLEEFNITSLTTTAYSHQENSLAELGCRELRRHLNNFKFTKPDIAWSQFLPYVERIMNTTLVPSMTYTPLDIVMGPKSLSRAGLTTPKAIADYVHSLDQAQRKLIQEHTDGLNRRQKAVAEFNSAHPTHTFQPGDKVLISNPVLIKSKLGIPRKLGPFTVVSQQDGKINIADLVKSGLIRSVHISRITPYVEEDNPPAMPDNFFVVNRILSHRFTDRKKLIVTVKWAGYDDTSEENISRNPSIRRTLPFLQYCQQHTELMEFAKDIIPFTIS